MLCGSFVRSTCWMGRGISVLNTTEADVVIRKRDVEGDLLPEMLLLAADVIAAVAAAINPC